MYLLNSNHINHKHSHALVLLWRGRQGHFAFFVLDNDALLDQLRQDLCSCRIALTLLLQLGICFEQLVELVHLLLDLLSFNLLLHFFLNNLSLSSSPLSAQL